MRARDFCCSFWQHVRLFLYPCNDWNDANSYFSVGKALFNGKMPYRDVFDQKGMYLYFLYGLAYLVSHTTFAGVYLLEGILAAFDLFGICRILMLYVKRNTALALSPLVLAVIISSRSFYWGGSAEEVCFPFLVWGLYLGLDYFMNRYPGEAMSRGEDFGRRDFGGDRRQYQVYRAGTFLCLDDVRLFFFSCEERAGKRDKKLLYFPGRDGPAFFALVCLFCRKGRPV